MSEGSKDAAILIAVSYQALMRAKTNNGERRFTDCTVLILFAGFYIEATLNYIFETTGKDITSFPLSDDNNRGRINCGLNDKLIYFYNEFVKDREATNWQELRLLSRTWQVEHTFPGLRALIDFRNTISHGEISMDAMSIGYAMEMRQRAKEIVNQLYQITEAKGFKIERLTTYKKAIAAIKEPIQEPMWQGDYSFAVP